MVRPPPSWGMGIGATVGQATRQAAPAPSVGASKGPPLPAAVWYYAVNGERKGPIDEAELRRVVKTADTLVWKQGMSNWTAAGEVPALAVSSPWRAGRSSAPRGIPAIGDPTIFQLACPTSNNETGALQGAPVSPYP